MPPTTATVDLSDAFLDAAAQLRQQIKAADAALLETEKHTKEYTRRRDVARSALDKLIAEGLPEAATAATAPAEGPP